MLHNFRPLLACLVAILLIGPLSAAPYKWVDEHGVTHYSQIPPAGKPSSEVRIREAQVDPAAAPSAARPPGAGLSATESLGGAEVETDESARVRQENCKRARENLGVLESNRRIRIKQDDDYRVLSDAERLEKIEGIKAQIREYCE
ncbi:MAG: DUF4124 domain-containing protein [Thiotrichales bacterium]